MPFATRGQREHSMFATAVWGEELFVFGGRCAGMEADCVNALFSFHLVAKWV